LKTTTIEWTIMIPSLKNVAYNTSRPKHYQPQAITVTTQITSIEVDQSGKIPRKVGIWLIGGDTEIC
jgi:hypothetical protein